MENRLKVFVLHPYENRQRQYTRSVSMKKLVKVMDDVLRGQQQFDFVGLSLDATFTSTPMHNIWKSYKRTLETIVGEKGVVYSELKRIDIDLAAQSFDKAITAVWGKSLQLTEPFSVNDCYLFVMYVALVEKYKPDYVIDVCLGKRNAYSDVAQALNAMIHGDVKLVQVDLNRV